MRKLALLTIIFVVATVFTGCSSDSVTVQNGYDVNNTKKIAIAGVIDNTNKFNEKDIKQLMTDALTDELIKNNLLASPIDKKAYLYVNILDYEEGNAAKRYLIPSWGATELKIKAILVEDKKSATFDVDINTNTGPLGYPYAWKFIFGEVAEKLVYNIKQTRTKE